MDALTPKKITDGFAGYEDQTEGSDQQQTTNVIQGSVIKFTNEASWVTRDGEELSPDLELVPINVIRVTQKWLDKKPVETIVLEPGQKFPDLEKLNNQTPRSEWSDGPDGNPRGPWQAQQILYLINLKTMTRYSFPTGTVGGCAAIRELANGIKFMRELRWPQVYPVVTLSDKFMSTKFGGRQRPDFLVKRWIDLSSGSEKALPAPQPAQLENSIAPELPANKPAEAGAAAPEKKLKTTKRGVTRFESSAPTVEPVTLKEELNDDLPDFTK
jgi:hypothetical protein